MKAFKIESKEFAKIVGCTPNTLRLWLDSYKLSKFNIWENDFKGTTFRYIKVNNEFLEIMEKYLYSKSYNNVLSKKHYENFLEFKEGIKN